MAGPIRIAVLADAGQARRELGTVAKDTSTLGSKLGNFGKAAGTAMVAGLAVAGAAAIKFGSDAVRAASDAQQSLGATETVFGRFAGTVEKTSEQAAQKYGLSANVYRENANLLGSLFKNQGVALDELAGKTEGMIGTAADLAATFGGTTTEAVEALGAAFKGEFDQLERYGVSIKQSDVNARLAAQGQDKLTGAALKAAQQQATTALIMEQAGQAQGAFAKESGTLAGQQQRLAAQFENIKATLGAALLPALTSLASTFNTTVLPAITGFIEGIQTGTGAGGAFAAVVGTLAANFGTIAPVVAVLVTGLVAYRAAMAASAAITAIQAAGTTAATGAQFSLNAALRANPIGAVVTAITLLVAGLVVAYKRSETFRNIVNALWGALRTAIGWVVNLGARIAAFAAQIAGPALAAVRAYIGYLAGTYAAAFRAAIALAAQIIAAVIRFGRAVVDRIQDVAKFVTGLKDKFGEAVQFVQGIPGKIKDALGDLGGLLVDAGRELISGLISGIASKIGELKSKMGEVAGAVKDFLPGSPVKTGPLTSWNRGGAGKRLMGMLADGIQAAAGQPVDEMARAVATLNDAAQFRVQVSGRSSGLSVAAGTTARQVTSTTPTAATRQASGTTDRDMAELIRLAKIHGHLLQQLIRVEAEAPIAFGKAINSAASRGVRRAK